MAVLIEQTKDRKTTQSTKPRWPIDRTLKVPLVGLLSTFIGGVLLPNGVTLLGQITFAGGLALFFGGILAAAIHAHLILFNVLPARVGDKPTAKATAIYIWIQTIVAGLVLQFGTPFVDILFYFTWIVASFVLGLYMAVQAQKGRSHAKYLTWTTVDEYINEHQMSGKIACAKCGSHFLRNLGWANKNDPRRIIKCGHCETYLYRADR